MKTRANNQILSGIALVITLLMLSVITFMAVSFLVLTRTHREQVNASVDTDTAQDMSKAALARAESVIIVRMKAHTNTLNFDYMASHNYINPNGFQSGVASPTNVFYVSNAPPQDVAQNIANLWYDPRAPVYITLGTNTDFRFWVDLNRNGRFETNGLLPYLQNNGQPLLINGVPVMGYFNGEPEWIGVLQYPESPHSATNRFIGRYSFYAQPIGKTLDVNFIHNYSRSDVANSGLPLLPQAMPLAGTIPSGEDGFARDQGVGSWELNLAGFLCGLDTDFYASPNQYAYSANLAIPANTGPAFDDAYSFLRFRYGTNYGTPYPYSLSYLLPAPYRQDVIDEFGTAGLFPTLSPSAAAPWPGGDTINHFYDIQDLFDPNKTSPGFTNRLLTAGYQNNSYDRYMFQRLISGIGVGSAPELQTWVYADGITTNPAVQPPTLPRTRVNINYDNSYQIANGLNTSPAVLVPWTKETNNGMNGALGFFTNAAESLLRSQNFRIINYDINGNPVSQVYNHFGVTNIPIYNSANPSIRYSEQIHRMLQLAANIYDATRTDTVVPSGSLPNPSVFRPLFAATNYGGTNQALFIIGYTNVTTDALSRIQSMVYPQTANQAPKLPSDPTITANDNVWGIPWVVGAVKGLPAFDRFVADTSWVVTRKLLFVRQNPTPVRNRAGNIIAWAGDPTKPPQYTNQFLIMSITNTFGMDAWNAYKATITQPCQVFATTVVSIALTNNSAQNPGGFATNFVVTTNAYLNSWRGLGSADPTQTANGMLAFLQTNVASMQPAYFSDSARAFFPVYGASNSSGLGYNIGSFLPGDLQQQYPWPLYNWSLTVTNRVLYALVDQSGRAVDFVNLGPFGTTYVLTNLMYMQQLTNNIPIANMGSSTPFSSYWNPAPAGIGLPSMGVLNQISNGVIHDPYFAAELHPGASNMNLATVNSNLYFSCSNYMTPTFPPTPASTVNARTLLVNDPLVHYTLGDLSPPNGDGSQVLTHNDRYEAWPYDNAAAQQQTIKANMTFKDPQIIWSDSWNFPTNEFPSIGWLGRVHRGTPWQTIFLKADSGQTSATGVNQNLLQWTGNWVSTADTYPTNDYGLLDLFTAAPNDNASRGLLSVNQTNDAPWYALFAGIIVSSNGIPTAVDPTSIAPLLNGIVITNYNANGVAVPVIVPGINATRAAEPDGNFRNLGSVFKSPMLTINSPFLPAATAGHPTEDEVEAIPRQVAGLLKLGQPQFVIYCFGQALKPKDIYFGSDRNFNLCTNYQITGEFVTRAVCHVGGDPAAANVKIQVDSFNIVPAD